MLLSFDHYYSYRTLLKIAKAGKKCISPNTKLDHSVQKRVNKVATTYVFNALFDGMQQFKFQKME